MSKWSETVASRCREAETISDTLKDAYIIWEDSTLGASGKVFVVGQINDTYFYVRYKYDSFQKQNFIGPFVIQFIDIPQLKQWLKGIREEGYEKADELLSVMKFFLT